MAESISNKTDDFNATNQANSIETSDDFIEMLTRNESPVNSLNEDANSDVEYKLTENSFEKKIPSLLDKFDFKIDTEIINNDELITVNNNDDFIDEDLYFAAKPNEVQFEHKHSASTLVTNNETANNSEPSAKITKHNESTEIKKEEEKIQLKTNEMIEFIIKMSKLKEKKKSEQKYSILTSTYQTEDYSRKKSYKTESKNKNIQTHLDSNESAFLWTELEAFMVQHEQTGQSSCGASAIINVLKALNFEIDYEKVTSMVQINSRIPESLASTTTLAQYLFSRSIAGMNATEMIQNIQRVTSNKINGRFFPFTSLQSNRIFKWLLQWIRKGAAPVALLNLQKTPIWGKTPDAWHHQMIYAVTSNDVYLTNPLERKPFDTFLRELNSDSSLLVRTEDVTKRFNENPKSLNEFLSIKDHLLIDKKRWFDLNVLGQVVNVLRTPNSVTHITIPASYVPGITLFAKQDSVLYEEILLEK